MSGDIHFEKVTLALTSWYHHPSWITMSEMKKKKKGADDPTVNNNRSDHKSSKPLSNITSADNKSNQKKGSKGKK